MRYQGWLRVSLCVLLVLEWKLGSFWSAFLSVISLCGHAMPTMWALCMHAKLLPLCLILCDPMDHSLPGSSVHGIFPAGILEWVNISSSRGSSRLRDWTLISCVFTLQMESLLLSYLESPPCWPWMALHLWGAPSYILPVKRHECALSPSQEWELLGGGWS